MTCQICFDTFARLHKVECGSTVDHLICFGCEKRWREKMPVVYGKRTMTCPTCRQPEKVRTVESLERELATLYVTPQDEAENALRAIMSLDPTTRAYIANLMLATTRQDSPQVPNLSDRRESSA